MEDKKIKKDSFPPIKSKKGTKSFMFPCGHFQDSMIGFGGKNKESIKYICSTCGNKFFEDQIEKKEILTVKSYKCWDCKMWISDIPINRIRENLHCANCGSLNKIKNNKKRDPIESRLRHEVLKRDNYKCIECGKGKDETVLHIDHIKPVSQGGSDELENLQTLCQACNLAKSNKKW